VQNARSDHADPQSMHGDEWTEFGVFRPILQKTDGTRFGTPFV